MRMLSFFKRLLHREEVRQPCFSPPMPQQDGVDFFAMQQNLEARAEIRQSHGALCLRWGIEGSFRPARLAAFVKAELIAAKCSNQFSNELVTRFESFLLADAVAMEPDRVLKARNTN